jgi:thiamine pyrophosphokinase
MRLRKKTNTLPEKEGCFFIMNKQPKIVLFANGSLPKPARVAKLLTKNDFLIAVDGGLGHISFLGFEPDMIVGDLDSVDQEQLQYYQKQNIKIEKFPPKKDQNDLELAMDAALQMNPEVIWIVAALGNRIDQTLGNIFLLTRPDLANIDVHLIDVLRDVFLIRKYASIQGKAGQTVSLIPIEGPVSGIQTEGLQYPLNNETLYPQQTRGISNCLTRAKASIKIEKGLLLCVHQLTTPKESRG